MIIVHEDDAPAMHAPEPFRRTLKVLLSPVLHPQLKTHAVGLSILSPGTKSDEHAHVESETFYVGSGAGHIKTAEGEKPLTPGTAAWSPPGESHQLINDGDETLKILWVLLPPGREAGIIANASQEKPPRAKKSGKA